MIRHIRGTLAAKGSGYVVVDAHGIGYLVHTLATLPLSFSVDDPIVLCTHLAVRENALELYGFMDAQELSMFELLLTLPKIGPKSALHILNAADITLIEEAVRTEDSARLEKLSTIGKKTAEKIVSGLKDKLEISVEQVAGDTFSSHENELFDALRALGYSHADAREMLRLLPSEHRNGNDAGAALRFLLTQKDG